MNSKRPKTARTAVFWTQRRDRDGKKKDTQKIYAAFAGKTKQELFELFHASPNGLSEEQIERSRETYGENAISYGKKHHSL